jgi:hypothetical protein
MRGVVRARTILAVRERLLEKAAVGGWFAPGTPMKAGIANQAAACKDAENRYMGVFRNFWMDEKLHRLRIHSVTTELYSRVFNEPAMVHPMFMQRNIFPRPMTSTSLPASTKIASISAALQAMHFGRRLVIARTKKARWPLLPVPTPVVFWKTELASAPVAWTSPSQFLALG